MGDVRGLTRTLPQKNAIKNFATGLCRWHFFGVKILITGATGFLGREAVQSALRRGHRVVALGGARLPAFASPTKNLRLDLLDTAALESLLLDEFPDAVVNCAAVADPAACAAAPARAAALNTALPERLAMFANHLSARLVHISTDMVFDGQRGHYAHTDMPAPLHPPAPMSLYGRVKLDGEKAVLLHGKRFAVVLRVPLLSGNSEDGTRSLHERLLARWAAGEKTPLFADEIRQPISASNLADAAVELCERDNLSGVYHWAGADALSRLEIGRRIAEKFGLSAAAYIVETTLAETGGASLRPRDLSLDLHPLRGKLRTPVQTFDTILDEMQIPASLAPWHKSQTGQSQIRRFVRGKDF